MKLGLGSAQFGLDYGVTNLAGRVAPHEVAAILAFAAARGVEIVDTAPAYGDGESALGAALSSSHRFKLVTKTLPLRMRGAASNAGEFVRTTYMRSLERLRQSSAYGLLVHDAEDLRGEDGEDLIEALHALRHEGLVHRIGVSVYTGAQIDLAIERGVAEIVQLPINVLDQRLLASGHLGKLKACRAEVHARSLFLQGLLLASPAALPEYLAGARAPLERFARWVAEERTTPAAAALAFAGQLGAVDHAIIGVTSAEQLGEIVAALGQCSAAARHFEPLACDDLRVVDPSRWPSKVAVQ